MTGSDNILMECTLLPSSSIVIFVFGLKDESLSSSGRSRKRTWRFEEGKVR